jgi:hypothetical protein
MRRCSEFFVLHVLFESSVLKKFYFSGSKTKKSKKVAYFFSV